ncbi:argininosuccinate lyase [Candidatus Nitrosotenuis cloacae]|uniref:Argininosuccinate lyase n=1 Tax=Candidatus Nitrosotenuis cloacae TaxID=1603555 RepID=A0A3G1B3K4_9ARCH|nr:argininosuccinate lyase [Candidatus Nitrosotenuis cloacae]AJZ76722.1 argininosuccinate lyase [Candidatus Nitrosotenuis cloacae]
MYRSRLEKNLDKHTLDYVSSISDDSEIALYDIIGSQAHSIMLYENNILSRAEVKKILSALEKIKKENLSAKSSAEDIHELIETLVIKKTGLEVGGKMHTARSRNDQVALDLRMKIRDDINVVCTCILDMVETLVVLAEKHTATAMPLYTHLQQAQIGTFSHFLISYSDALLRDFERLYDTFGRVNHSPLGAGPVGGTSLPINRNSTAKMLGFSGIVENSIDATSNRDVVAEYVGHIAILMTNLSRIAEDLVIWSTSEFSFVELSDQFSSPSSVMPQKKNPDILELTRGKTARVIGSLVAILSNLKGLASGYGRDLQEIKPSVFFSSRTAISALVVLNSMFATLKVNKQKMNQIADSGYLAALDIAEALVKEGLPFRSAHKIVGNLVHTAHESKISLSELTTSEVAKSVSSKEFDAKKLGKIISSINAESSLKNRSSLGSAGISEQKRLITKRKSKIKQYRNNITRRSAQISLAIERLSSNVRTLCR